MHFNFFIFVSATHRSHWGPQRDQGTSCSADGRCCALGTGRTGGLGLGTLVGLRAGFRLPCARHCGASASASMAVTAFRPGAEGNKAPIVKRTHHQVFCWGLWQRHIRPDPLYRQALALGSGLGHVTRALRPINHRPLPQRGAVAAVALEAVERLQCCSDSSGVVLGWTGWSQEVPVYHHTQLAATSPSR